jgi:TRAP-type C4-dicarboxylate transport system substrate-binding protein
MKRINSFKILLHVFATTALVVAFLLCLTPATVSAARPIELKFAHQNPPAGRTTVKFLDPWMKKVEEVTKGRVKIISYPAQSLCKARESIEAVRGGLADITWTIPAYFPGRFPLSTVMELPFLSLPSGHIDGKEVCAAEVNGRIMQELFEEFPEMQAEFKGIKQLFFNSTGSKILITRKVRVENMKDLKGMKIREIGAYASEMWKKLGAIPMNIPMPDVYEAASKGVIEGFNMNWGGIDTWKYYEPFNYWTDAPTIVTTQMTLMNEKKWNSLPKDIQEAIASVSGVYGAQFGGREAFGFDVREETLATAKKQGETFEKVSLEPGEYERWVEVGGRPIWNQWVKDMEAKGFPGQKILDEAQRLVKKYK